MISRFLFGERTFIYLFNKSHVKRHMTEMEPRMLAKPMQACELARSWLLWNSNDRDRGNSCGSMQGFSVLTRSLGGAVVAGGSVRLRGMRVCAGSGLGYRSYRIHSGFLGVLGWRWVEGWGLRLLSIK